MTRALVAVLLVSVPALATTRRVTTVSELQSALAAANPGDDIVLAAGTYTLTSKLNLSRAGTAQAPITLRSETPLAARIDSNTVVAIGVSAPFWHVEGLEMHGVCADDSSCEHALQVTGSATDFVLRGNRLIDFNAQLKVNATPPSGATPAQMPHRGLVELNEIFDTRGRMTSNPVTKLNIDTGDDWVVRDNYLHDFFKNGGNFVSYGSFMKSGGARGLYERNLVICNTGAPASGDARIGLSFGGGGTAPQFCNPAFDAATPCSVEHRDGVLRNNIIVNCSDVAVYVNRGANTRVLYNTFVATNGVDFRFSTTTGEAIGNVTASSIRGRDQGTFTSTANRLNVSQATFDGWYRAPSSGDLRMAGDVSSLIDAGPVTGDVVDDFCGRLRPAAALTLGALEHSLGDCDTHKPAAPAMNAPDAGATSADAGVDAGQPVATPDSGGPPFDDGGFSDERGPETVASCGCAGGGETLLLGAALGWLLRRRAHRVTR